MMNFVKNNLKNLWIKIAIFVAFMPISASATHIIGGDMTYRFVGNNQYEVTLTLRRDCQLGQVSFDPQASIGIYGVGINQPFTLIDEVRISFMESDTVGNTIVSACGFEGSEVCVQRTSYRDTITLPFRQGGYIVAYQRCCRNGSLGNIINPLETGTTEWIHVTEDALLTGNSSPTFKNWPEVYICANQPLIFDHSGSDIDGDSLVYKLCTPHEGADIVNNTPQPPFLPPFGLITWRDPYRLDDMMGGTPLVIDPQTGILTANPNLVGQFLIGVCMEEYRNGVLISKVMRDFQYNVRVCSTPVVADFDIAVDPCDSLSFKIANKSIDADVYEWNFNFPSTDPKYLFTVENPSFSYDTPGAYTIRLVAKSNNGACDSIVTRQILAFSGANIPDLNIIADEITLCAGEKVSLLTNANPNNTYQWSPMQGLDLSDPTNPIFIGTESGLYSVTVTNLTFCSNSATINIIVKPGTLPISIMGDTDICDNQVSLVATGSSGIFEWSLTEDFNIIISNNETLSVNQTIGEQKYFVRSTQSECGELVEDIIVRRRPIMIDFEKAISICKGSEKNTTIANFDLDQNLTFTWNDPHIIKVENGTVTVLSNEMDTSFFIINGLVTNQYGCAQDITIRFDVLEVGDVTFDAILKSCDDHTMCFDIVGSYDGNVKWTFGSGLSQDTSDLTRPCFTYAEGGIYIVSLINTSSECPFEPFTKTITVPNISDQSVNVEAELTNCNDNKVCFKIEGSYVGDLSWNFGDVNSNVNTSAVSAPCHSFSGPGTYQVSLENMNVACPFSTVITVVTIDQPFKLNPIGDRIICEGENLTLNAETNGSNVTFVWYDDQGKVIGNEASIIINPMSDTDVTVKATNSKGCTDSLTMHITIFKFDYTIDLPQVICPEEEFQIKVNINSPANYNFEWSPTECVVMGGNTSQPIILAIPGKTITVVITNKETGCRETRNIMPEIKAPIIFNISGELCNDQPSSLNINIVNPENYTYLWSPSAFIISGGNTSSPVVKIMPGQALTVVVTDKISGCSKEVSYTPTVLPSLVVTFIESNIEISQGKSTELVIKNPVADADYLWSTGEMGTSITITPLETTTYTVTVTDTNGCTGIGVITVTVRTVTCTDKDEYLPNAFTPNGDTHNDILYVKSNVITEMTLVIYNRWGQEMFSTHNITEGWDGKSKQGVLLSPDVYAYYLKATCVNGDSFIKKGNVSLLK